MFIKIDDLIINVNRICSIKEDKIIAYNESFSISKEQYNNILKCLSNHSDVYNVK